MHGVKKENKKNFASMKRLFRYVLKYKGYLAGVAVFVIIANLLTLMIPYITGIMVDAIEFGEGKVRFDVIVKGGFAILAIGLITWGLSALQNILMLKTAQNVVLDLRHDVFAKLVKLPVSYFDTNTKGNIISIVTTDIDNISETVSADLITLLTGAVTVTGSFLFMLSISPMMTSVFVFTVPAMFFVARLLSKKARILFREKKTAYGEICGYSEEMITAQKTVKIYGIEEYNEDTFVNISERLMKSGAKAEFASSLMMPTMNGLNNLNFTLICTIGAFLGLKGLISVGNISSFVMYSKRFSGPIIDTANIMNMFQVSLAACDRVFSILDYEEEKDDGLLRNEQAKFLEEIQGNIQFDQVSFSYIPNQPVLKKVDLEIKKGEKVAIVGATGSGKTTIISLLMRFYDVSQGAIRIDGKDIREFPLTQLRRQFALVLQDSWLFEGSVYENIQYGAPWATNEQVEKMCQEIDIDTFIRALPKGYDTILRSDSGGLSAGQKQLLSIARTFLCDPKIFILDEATSSVDPLTEQKIKEVTDTVTKGKTSFIIAHRLSTILNADKILVMKQGQIHEIGTHEELLAREGLYKTLYESQFATEEAS